MPTTSLHTDTSNSPLRGQNNASTWTARLHKLKAKFESDYYGKSPCLKYENAREFTINLNRTLFVLNSISNAKTSNIFLSKNLDDIVPQIRKLEHDLEELIIDSITA